MFIQRTGVGRLALCASVVATLAACSQSPSESDVRKGVEQNLHIADCDLFKITKFDKVNGVKVDDRHYEMQMAAEVVMKPARANVRYLTDLDEYLKSHKEARDEADASLQKYAKDVSDGVDALRASLSEDQQAAYNTQIRESQPGDDRLAAAVSYPLNVYSDMYLKQHPDVEAAALKAWDTTTAYHDKVVEAQNIRSVFSRNIVAECPNVSPNLVSTMLATDLKPSQYSDDVRYSYTATYYMLLTDNGWQLAN